MVVLVVLIMVRRYDTLQLAGCVGSETAGAMLAADSPVHRSLLLLLFVLVLLLGFFIFFDLVIFRAYHGEILLHATGFLDAIASLEPGLVTH